MRMILLERIEDLEIWKLLEGRAQRFAVKLNTGRVRIVDSLPDAHALVGGRLRLNRLARAH